MSQRCCCNEARIHSLAAGLLSPGNSEAAVRRLTEILEMCRECGCADCAGITELLIQATVLSAIDRCDENALQPKLLDGLLPSEPLVGEG